MTVRNAATMGAYGATWEFRGYAGQGNVGDIIKSLVGRQAIVCGGAAGVFEEMGDALTILHGQGIDPVIFAVNEIGMFLPRVDHWVSLHSDNLGAWKTVRWLHPKPQEFTKYHSDMPRPYIDFVWQQLTPQMCLSGYYAMQIAWVMGVDRIILCGCPGNRTRRFFEASPRARDGKDEFGYGGADNGNDKSVREQVEKEMTRLPDFKGAVRSMSGWTKDYFGGLTNG